MRKPNEERFEKHIEQTLIQHGFTSRLYTEYDRNQCQLQEELIEFIKTTQQEEYDKLYKQFDTSTDKQLSKIVNEQISKRGIIDVLRKGISTRGCSFDMVYFEPKSGLNPEHQSKFEKNRFVSVRQLHYSPNNNNSIDIVIFINGIPILTIELKNQLTGQTVDNSDKQYRFDRNPKGEPLLKFQTAV